MKYLKYLLFLLLPVCVSAQRGVDLSSMQLPPSASLICGGGCGFSTFSSTSGSASTDQTVTISGISLTNNVVCAFTGSGASSFEVSKDGTTYASTQTLTVSGGIVTGQPITIHVRLTASASIGTPSCNFTVSSIGVSPITFPLTGTVISGSTAHYRQLDIPNTSVSGGSNLTNFTAEITISGSYLATVGNGGKVQNSNGFDITFSTDNAGSSLLNWEIEKWNPITGALTAWVKIPTLSSSTTTTIFLRYGSTSITTFQGGATGSAWDANTIAAYHFSDAVTGSGQTVADFSANGHSMTTAGTWSSANSVTGISGNALKLLNANSDRMTFTSIALNSTYTIEGWYQATSGLVDGDTYSWANSSTFDVIAFGDPGTFFGLFSGGGAKIQDASPVSGNTWYHMVFTRTGTTWIMYRNGTQVATNTTAVNIAFNNIGTVFSGFSNDELIDEHRLYSVVRTAGWIATEYNNQNANGSWFTVGAEV